MFKYHKDKWGHVCWEFLFLRGLYDFSIGEIEEKNPWRTWGLDFKRVGYIRLNKHPKHDSFMSGPTHRWTLTWHFFNNSFCAIFHFGYNHHDGKVSW